MSSGRREGFFTLGVDAQAYRLPHPKLGLPFILLVHRVVSEALVRLRQNCYPLGTAHEDEITATLLGVIENDFRKSGGVPGFNRKTFGKVIRHPGVENYNFERLKTEPDLCFAPAGEFDPGGVLSTQYALFVECKPIDSTHPVGNCYCDNGMSRFVVGDYAWAMQEALMVGYVRDRKIDPHLLAAMQSGSRPADLKTIDLPFPVGGEFGNSLSEVLHRSAHRRDFPWPDQKGAATHIEIYHSWHLCV